MTSGYACIPCDDNTYKGVEVTIHARGSVMNDASLTTVAICYLSLQLKECIISTEYVYVICGFHVTPST